MIELVVVFTGISLLLYVILGGADFGAGIIEIFTGNKGRKTISNAIAPIWEANHIWLIVVIVILFTAFPLVYSTVTMYLHIPILLVLIGIIFRGTSFAFRYYDPYHDKSHKIYTLLFKLFSVFTPFFLGVTLGAVILGDITTGRDQPFYVSFMNPWLQLFPSVLGVFTVILFAFLAAVYLVGDANQKENREEFAIYAKRLLFLLIGSGILVFLSAQLNGLSLIKMYLKSWVGITSVVLATILIPVFFYSLRKNRDNLLRVIVGAQTTAILSGWFGVQYPVLMTFNDTAPLTVYDAAAPYRTLLLLVLALIVGLALIIPLFIYLFRVFKFTPPAQEY